ncbi:MULTISPECIES: hypothetical protein [Paenibacillus]|uniref:Uncharacterized protein n=1 Tax=Paenibacillus naphthalenovorans TaxID=162209 RepID=A0A0U2WAS6_9BACL|nr:MULTISPECIES: hypothetical protein [Paenibacillus]ALS24557.1 hypothetical protein IJ22_42630 [Paenibacillus naphthalenovorans]NTZ20817.1 hypothetical protein [Paenibacillus sp. JMULE4]GCL73598.1 hypothetical protein PN4B1_35370 [Paenibacillus naphthalenovorans]SDJ11384.1 hypothetical protein SAMN05421868_11776 [Paenibacillus naphthalenovorans]
MSADHLFYIIYDEFSISICTQFDEVIDAVTGGAFIYGYTDDEAMAYEMMKDCFNKVELENNN